MNHRRNLATQWDKRQGKAFRLSVTEPQSLSGKRIARKVRTLQYE